MKQTQLTLKTALLMRLMQPLLGLVMTIAIACAPAQAAPECAETATGESGLLTCYQKEFSETLKGNDQRATNLSKRAKTLLEEASETKSKRQVSSYLEFLQRLNQTVVASRKSATSTCVRMAAKFESTSTSAVAAANCRTGYELELDKDLRRLELQLEVLSIR